jgi:hypothetical protein
MFIYQNRRQTLPSVKFGGGFAMAILDYNICENALMMHSISKNKTSKL